VFTLLWALVGGTIIGLIGRAIASRDIPLWATIVCGIGGVLLGNWLYVGVFGFSGHTRGIDWWRHVWQVVVAALLVVGAASVLGRRASR
jgi:uncharacterized membrane protein YeaQ/YmgE (transglycosylase-associated protein family)